MQYMQPGDAAALSCQNTSGPLKAATNITNSETSHCIRMKRTFRRSCISEDCREIIVLTS
jgi:hypothetical protein